MPVVVDAAPAKARSKPARATEDAPPPRGTVLDIYDMLRSARMNVMYYGDRLWWLQAQAVTIDLITALAASSGLVTAWKSAGFTGVPKLMGVTVAILTVVRPILNLQQRVKRVSGQWAGYLSVFHTAEQIARVVRAERTVTAKQRTLLANVHDRFDALEKTDDPAPSGKKLDMYQQRVIAEIPVDDWWLPPAIPAPAIPSAAATVDAA